MTTPLDKPVLWSIGHSNKSGDELVALLVEHSIDTLVDVRTSPRSRWPQFNDIALKKYIPLAGIGYEHRGKNLGGLGRNVRYEETLDQLVKRAADGEKIAFMCSEGNPDDCHRKSMLTPQFLKRGATVIHIMWKGADHVEGDIRAVERVASGPLELPDATLFDLAPEEYSHKRSRRATPTQQWVAP